MLESCVSAELGTRCPTFAASCLGIRQTELYARASGPIDTLQTELFERGGRTLRTARWNRIDILQWVVLFTHRYEFTKLSS